MRIREVEALVGVTKKNIRFYEQEGLLAPGRSQENSYRDYTEADVERLRRIKLLRMLGMPISEIRELLEGRTALNAAARRHIERLEGQIRDLGRAAEVCQLLAVDSSEADTLDAGAYLDKMERMEKEGVAFVNIKNRDVSKKYAGAVIACFAVVALMTAVMLGLFSLFRQDEIPVLVKAVLTGIPALVAVGTIIALISRIREIRRGEENDLSNY